MTSMSSASRKRASPGRSHICRLGLVQLACQEQPKRNTATACRLVEKAARQGADLVVLPELFRTRYFPQREDAAFFDRAEPIPGPTTKRLGRLARKLGITLVAPLFEKRAPGLYHNTAVTLGPTGRIIGRYRKMHIPDDPRFYEKYYFTPGDLGFAVVPTGKAAGGISLGTLICWDQWYPEAARLMALAGAELLAYPTAIGWWRGEPAQTRRRQLEAGVPMRKAHAISNGVFVAAANRIGVEDELEFWGHSLVCAPDGRVVARAEADEETVLLADIDLQEIAQQRQGWPFLRDRRLDAYGGLTRRYLDAPASNDDP